MSLLSRLFAPRPAPRGVPLYEAIVARGREPHWYQAGEVPDTLDGRFDMIAAVLSVVLLRLEREDDDDVRQLNTALAERFVDDMDGQLRQIGFGDMIVGKHIGRMMAMLGGRLGAYRDGIAAGDLKPALTRNLYRGAAPADEAIAHVERELLAFADRLVSADIATLEAGRLP